MNPHSTFHIKSFVNANLLSTQYSDGSVTRGIIPIFQKEKEKWQKAGHIYIQKSEHLTSLSCLFSFPFKTAYCLLSSSPGYSELVCWMWPQAALRQTLARFSRLAFQLLKHDIKKHWSAYCVCRAQCIYTLNLCEFPIPRDLNEGPSDGINFSYPCQFAQIQENYKTQKIWSWHFQVRSELQVCIWEGWSFLKAYGDIWLTIFRFPWKCFLSSPRAS